MTNRRVDEQQDAMELIARHAKRLGCDGDRFAEFVARDAACLLARYDKRTCKLARKILALARKHGRFEPAPNRWVMDDVGPLCRNRRHNMKVEQEKPPLLCAGGEKQFVEFASQIDVHLATRLS